MAVLGELPPSSGSINIVGKVAYVSQQAWIFSGSIRQNIIFGSKYDKARFDKAVKASALHKVSTTQYQGYSNIVQIEDASVYYHACSSIVNVKNYYLMFLTAFICFLFGIANH